MTFPFELIGTTRGWYEFFCSYNFYDISYAKVHNYDNSTSYYIVCAYCQSEARAVAMDNFRTTGSI